MEVTLVEFRAFDKACQDYFVGKSLSEIHAALQDRCNTYQVLSIIQCDEARPVPLAVFQKFTEQSTHSTMPQIIESHFTHQRDGIRVCVAVKAPEKADRFEAREKFWQNHYAPTAYILDTTATVGYPMNEKDVEEVFPKLCKEFQHS